MLLQDLSWEISVFHSGDVQHDLQLLTPSNKVCLNFPIAVTRLQDKGMKASHDLRLLLSSCLSPESTLSLPWYVRIQTLFFCLMAQLDFPMTEIYILGFQSCKLVLSRTSDALDWAHGLSALRRLRIVGIVKETTFFFWWDTGLGNCLLLELSSSFLKCGSLPLNTRGIKRVFCVFFSQVIDLLH